MPHNSRSLTRPFQGLPRAPATYERGRDLCTFVSVAASHVMRTLQKPCRSKPSKRKVNHRRFLQNQICRSFSDIEAATRRLASSILSQEACVSPAVTQQRAPPQPCTAILPSTISSFSGVAEAFVAPDPSPSWALSLDSLASDPDELFEPIITRKTGLEVAGNWEPLNLNSSGGSSLVEWAAPPPASQPHSNSVSCMEPLVVAEQSSPSLDEGALMISDHDTYLPLWDLEMW